MIASLKNSFAVALLVLSIVALITASSTVNAQIITLTEPSPSIMNLNISFANNTNATLTNEPITEEQGNLIVAAVNTVLVAGLAEDLEDLELEEELEEIEEIEEEESDSDNSGSNNGNGDDNNGNDSDEPDLPEDDNGNNGNGGEPGLPPEDPIILPPTPAPPDENEGGNESAEQELEIRIEGCPEGYGYHKDGPYLCYPIEDGELNTEPPQGAYCAALGCPYNPPSIDPTDLS